MKSIVYFGFASNETNTTPNLSAFATTVTVAASYFILKSLVKMISRCCKKDTDTSELPRRMSFTSASMASRPFPDDCNMCDPIINAAIFMKELPEMEDMIKMVNYALSFERMSGVPVGTKGKNDWKMKPISNIDPAMLIRSLSMSGSDEDLVNFIGKHMQDSLTDYSSRDSTSELPWWEFLVIENKDSNSGSAVVLRIEHCLADGLSLVNLFEGFLTNESGEPVKDLIPISMENKFQKQKKNKWSLYCKVVPSFFKVLALPASKFDSDTVFSKSANKEMKYNGKRKIIVFDNIPLPLIKDIKNANNVTVNDVLLATLSLTISEYNRMHGCIVSKSGKDIQCRVLMPVALPREKGSQLRNKWVFISVNIGLSIPGIKARLLHVHETMKKFKNSPIAMVQLCVQETIPPKLPLNVSRQTVFDSFCRHSAVFSNVPGPAYICNFANKPVDGCQMFFNNLIPQIGILSYNNQVFMNMILDPDSFPSSDKLRTIFKEMLVKLAIDSNVKIPDNY